MGKERKMMMEKNENKPLAGHRIKGKIKLKKSLKIRRVFGDHCFCAIPLG